MRIVFGETLRCARATLSSLCATQIPLSVAGCEFWNCSCGPLITLWVPDRFRRGTVLIPVSTLTLCKMKMSLILDLWHRDVGPGPLCSWLGDVFLVQGGWGVGGALITFLIAWEGVTYFRGRVYTTHDSLHTCDMYSLIHICHCATPWLKTCLHSRKTECSMPPCWPQVFTDLV